MTDAEIVIPRFDHCVNLTSTAGAVHGGCGTNPWKTFVTEQTGKTWKQCSVDWILCQKFCYYFIYIFFFQEMHCEYEPVLLLCKMCDLWSESCVYMNVNVQWGCFVPKISDYYFGSHRAALQWALTSMDPGCCFRGRSPISIPPETQRPYSSFSQI